MTLIKQKHTEYKQYDKGHNWKAVVCKKNNIYNYADALKISMIWNYLGNYKWSKTLIIIEYIEIFVKILSKEGCRPSSFTCRLFRIFKEQVYKSSKAEKRPKATQVISGS